MAKATWAVERWADFPVQQDPRPWVFTGPIVCPEKGFRTGDAKLAFLRGDVEVEGWVPNEVLAILHDRTHRSGPDIPPLALNGGTKSETSFSTDRGPRLLPAWRFQSEDLLGPLWVIDSEVAASRWKPTAPPRPAPSGARLYRSTRSNIEADDRTLHFEFTGGDPRWVDFPTSEVIETEQAVVIIPIEDDHGPPGPRRLVGHRREVVAHLQHHLANRVLVNLDASPVTVTCG